MRLLLDILYLATACALSPVIAYRAVRHGRYRTGWDQRFGRIQRKHPQKQCIWLHAVSLGEVNAARTLIAQLEQAFADTEIILSATTDTGFAQATALYGRRLQVFYYPLDLSFVVRRAFQAIRPNLCLLMELEVWPNFLRTADEIHIPVVVVNGRISDKSFRRYRSVRFLTKTFFSKLTLVCTQTDEYARRFVELGCPADHVICTGSLKYDTAQVSDRVEGADILAEQLFGKPKTPFWVAGGTGDGEEDLILDVYRRLIEQKEFEDLRLAIVPRKPERFDEVAALIKEKGFSLIRYSDIKQTNGKLKIEDRKLKIAVVLGDTMGDLRKFYSLATIILVGRSLVPMGGSDMMEAAALGKCTLFGPHTFNFKQTVEDLLRSNGAILVKNEQDLLEAMKKCLLDSDFAHRIAHNGREVIQRNQGATARTIAALTRILPPACPQEGKS